MIIRNVPICALFALTTHYPRPEGPVRSLWRHLGPSAVEPGIHWAERLTPRDGYPARDRFAARCDVQDAPEGSRTSTEPSDE